MDKTRILITRKLPGVSVEPLRESAAVELWEQDCPMPNDLFLERVKGVDGLLCMVTDRVDDQMMATAGSSLRVVSQMAVGFDNIDVAAATRRGLPVGHTPGVLTETTADFAFALLMAAARRISEAERFVRAHRWMQWSPTLLLGQDIHAATLGLVGLGRIGSAVARRAKGFGMRVMYYDMFRNASAEAELGIEFAPLEDVLRQADFISLHTPLTPETRHLINRDSLRLMKPTAVVINTSRGPVVDHAALYEALRDGVIAYAALDVTDPEPIPASSPLLTLENIIVVPHIASASAKTRARMAEMALSNLQAGLSGSRLPYCANPQVYDS